MLCIGKEGMLLFWFWDPGGGEGELGGKKNKTKKHQLFDHEGNSVWFQLPTKGTLLRVEVWG